MFPLIHIGQDTSGLPAGMCHLNIYFPSALTEDFDWIRDPIKEFSTGNLSLQMQQQLVQIREDGSMKMLLNDGPLDCVWLSAAKAQFLLPSRAG